MRNKNKLNLFIHIIHSLAHKKNAFSVLEFQFFHFIHKLVYIFMCITPKKFTDYYSLCELSVIQIFLHLDYCRYLRSFFYKTGMIFDCLLSLFITHINQMFSNFKFDLAFRNKFEFLFTM